MTKINKSRFTVILSVYHEETPEYLEAALTSIWDEQTVRPNEIVVVEDGLLTSELNKVIAFWKNKLGQKLVIVKLIENVGLGKALNEGLKYCSNELVARMDTDDMAYPERFAKQLAFMDRYPEIVASSAVVEEWDESLQFKLAVRELPTESDDLFAFAKRRSPLSHPTSIFRKSIILEVGGYPALRKAQDHALWSLLLSKGYKLGNLPDVLLRMRTGNELFVRRGWKYFKYEYEVLQFQKKIGFLSSIDFIINCTFKAALRISPRFVKRWVYKLVR